MTLPIALQPAGDRRTRSRSRWKHSESRPKTDGGVHRLRLIGELDAAAVEILRDAVTRGHGRRRERVVTGSRRARLRRLDRPRCAHRRAEAHARERWRARARRRPTACDQTPRAHRTRQGLHHQLTRVLPRRESGGNAPPCAIAASSPPSSSLAPSSSPRAATGTTPRPPANGPAPRPTERRPRPRRRRRPSRGGRGDRPRPGRRLRPDRGRDHVGRGRGLALGRQESPQRRRTGLQEQDPDLGFVHGDLRRPATSTTAAMSTRRWTARVVVS